MSDLNTRQEALMEKYLLEKKETMRLKALLSASNSQIKDLKAENEELHDSLSMMDYQSLDGSNASADNAVEVVQNAFLLLEARESKATCSGGNTNELEMRKEYFMVTASAIKLNGYGLDNDLCNVSNEALYDEACFEGVTFDKYYTWIIKRLS